MSKELVICADAITGLKEVASSSVDMCVTSPPYFGLRDYGVSGQIGLEETPLEYINRLVDVFREVHRVLKTDGTLWVNIGDSYAGSGHGYISELKGKQATNRGCELMVHRPPTPVPEGVKHKDLLGIPWMLAFALRAEGWFLRNDIIWHKPNAMPESVKDRCTQSHEHIFLLAKSRRYYYNSEAIKEPSAYAGDHRVARGRHVCNGKYRKEGKLQNFKHMTTHRNKRDVWKIPTRSFPGAHFATFPPDLIRPCILAGSRPGGIVIDPFFGAGTTGLVAVEEERGYIGIDLNPEYVLLAEQRIKALCYK